MESGYKVLKPGGKWSLIVEMDRCLMNQDEVMQQFQSAVALHNKGELDQAETIYRQVLAVDADNFYGLKFLGSLLRLKRNLQESIFCLRKAVLFSPQDKDASLWLARAYADNGQFDEVVSVLSKCLSFHPVFPEAYVTFGRALYECMRYEESRINLEKAVKLNSSVSGGWGWLNLGNTFKKQAKNLEAIASYRKAIEINPDFADAYFNLGNVLKEEGEVEEAIASYRKVIEVKSDHEKAIEYLVSALIALERWEEASDVVGLYKSAMKQGSYLDFLRFLASRRQGSYLNTVDLSNPNCIYELKYSLLRKLRSWICTGDWLEDVYDSLYSEMYAEFGIQGLDTTAEVYTLKPLQQWFLPPCVSLNFRVYASRFAVGSDSLQFSGPFSSDINHLSHAGHFYLILSAKFGEKVDMAGRRIQIKLDYGIDALPSSNLCLGFSARVCDDWRRDERSHSYVELIEDSAGVMIADVTPETLKELGLNEEHFTAEKYKLWDPVETAQHASGMFLFLRSSDYPVNPKGSVTIHSFNVICVGIGSEARN